MTGCKLCGQLTGHRWCCPDSPNFRPRKADPPEPRNDLHVGPRLLPKRTAKLPKGPRRG